MGRWLLFFIGFTLTASESFITPQEYAAQLYHNPRGIGCHLCHGERGEGKDIAKFVHKGEKRVFSAPAINQTEYRRFVRVLDGRIKGMPRYFLTPKERQALYRYLHPDVKE